MADTKITALTAITTVDPAVDVLPIVDVSDTTMAASGTTKKITSNQILGAGGTATLASATISGDLTVDTTTLKVDSANDRVGVGTVSPTASFHTSSDGVVSGAGWTVIGRFNNVANSKGIDLGYNPSNNNTVLSALTAGATSGFEFWSFDGSWSNRMTLNSTGLGVGLAPANDKLLVSQTIGLVTSTTADVNFRNIGNTTIQRIRYDDSTGGLTIGSALGTAYPVQIGGNTTTRAVIIDGSSNVGIGGNASVTGIDTGVARLFVVAPNSNTGMAATFIADSVGRGLLVADQGKTNSFGVEVVAGLVKTGGFTSGTSVALFANAVERARVKSTGQVRFVPLAADPAGAEAGDVYYNSTSNKLKCYNGTTWNDLF